MNIVNLTMHDIRIRMNTGNKEAAPDPTDIILPPSGAIARVKARSEVVDTFNDIPIVSTFFGELEGLPDQEEGTIYVTSMLAAQKAAMMGRRDVVSPNTSPNQDIRGGDNKTFAVFGFQRF